MNRSIKVIKKHRTDRNLQDRVTGDGDKDVDQLKSATDHTERNVDTIFMNLSDDLYRNHHKYVLPCSQLGSSVFRRNSLISRKIFRYHIYSRSVQGFYE